ncbi:MAG TPA: GC-type dockerin domain-anchored protein, partial [Phycisphaerales bacterium]|nr:GC-type dockerin domain-anchored protein [Phycisphaerales bacterium]
TSTTSSRRGNPYATVGLGNIYELDTLPGVINPPTKKTCPGDFNFDGTVDALDLLFFLTQWGPCPQGQECAADFNGDGVVDIRDMLIFLSKVWGPC